MTIVYSARNYAAGTAYYTSGGNATSNPGNFLETELTNFVNGIGNSGSLRIEKAYSNHTTFNGTDTIRFLLNTPEGGVGAAAGVMMGYHTCGTGAASGNAAYHTWSASVNNNGAGTWTAYGPSHSGLGSLTSTLGTRMMIVYDLGAALPWFAYACKTSDGSFLGGESLHRVDSSVVDTKIYTYVPKAGKWLKTLWVGTGTSSYGNVATPNSTTPIEARLTSTVAEGGGADWCPNSGTRSLIQFPTTMHGNMGFLGLIEQDSMGVSGSNTVLHPALQDESRTVLGKTYTRFGQRWWVRTA